MFKITRIVILSIIMIVSVFAQSNFTVDRQVELGEDFQARYVTHNDGRKAILVLFPEKYLSDENVMAKGLQIVLVKLYGENEFGPKAIVITKLTESHGILILSLESKTLWVTVKPLITSNKNLVLAGVELQSKLLNLDN